MALEVNREKARQRAITKSEGRRTTQATRTENLAVSSGGGSWRPAIIRSVDVVLQKIMFQFLANEESPPNPGSLNTLGDVTEGYPFPTFTAEFFLSHVIPIPIRPTNSSLPVLVKKNANGDWIVMEVDKSAIAAAVGTYVYGGQAPLCGLFFIENNDMYQVDFWSKRAPLSCPARRFHCGAMVDQAIYSFAGSTNASSTTRDNSEYKPDFWVLRNPVREPSRRSSSCFAVDGLAYIAGGRVPDPPGFPVRSNVVSRYNPVTDTWLDIEPLFFVSAQGSAFSLTGAGYVIEGRQSTTDSTNTKVRKFTPSSGGGSWSAVRPVPETGQRSAAAFGLLGFGYLTAGDPFRGERTDIVVQYNPVADVWDHVDRLAIGRRDHSAATLGDKGYVHGGDAAFLSGGQTNISEEYDPASNTWISTIARSPLPDRNGAVAASLQ